MCCAVTCVCVDWCVRVLIVDDDWITAGCHTNFPWRIIEDNDLTLPWLGLRASFREKTEWFGEIECLNTMTTNNQQGWSLCDWLFITENLIYYL